MGFLSPLLLASAAVLAMPLWLHLRRKRRQTPLEFPSLRYLKAAAARMKRQARVEDVALLLLRLLLVALLAVAFARPVVRSAGGWLGAGRSVESVVVIDATASMGWRGDTGARIDAAKRLAREWINGLDRSDSVALWVLTDRLEKPVPLPITDRAFLFDQLDEVMASDGSSNLAPVFNAAREWADAVSIGRKELVVITDNQPAAWDWPAEGFFKRSWKRGGVGLVVLSPDAVMASNGCVESVEWDERTVREGALLTGVAKVANHGGTTLKDLLECHVNDGTVLRKPLEIPAGGSVDVPLSLAVPAMKGPVLKGDVSLAGDALACDDKWYFALPVRHPLNALIVEGGKDLAGGSKPSFFLTKALAAGGAGAATVIGSDAWAGQSTGGFDSLWFVGGALTDFSAWEKSLEYARAGGTVVVTADSQPDPLPAIWPVTAGVETRLPAGRMATRLLAPDHFLFDGVWNGETPFPPLPQRIARGSTPAAGAKPLATLAGGFPLLVELPCGKGRVLWLNASADRTWGDFPLSPAYVALVQQMARAKELALQIVTTGHVGEAWPDLAKLPVAAAWPAAEDGKPAERMPRGGLYDALSADGETIWSCAVNVRRAESDLRAVDTAKLDVFLPGKALAGEKGIREWRGEIRREVPLWPWLLAAAALVYLTEGWAAARAAERRGLGAGTALPRWMERRARA